MRRRPAVLGALLAVLLVAWGPMAAAQDRAEDDPGAQSPEERPPRANEEPGSSGAASLTRAIQGEQGLTIQTLCTNCNEADLELGGLDDSHVNVVRDGFSLRAGLPRIHAFSILPSAAVSNVEASAGPGFAEHSYEAVGGTVSVTSREPGPRPFVQAVAESGSSGWNKLALLVDGRAGPFSARVSGTRLQVDEIDADGDGNDETGRIDQWSALAEAVFDLDRAGALRVGWTRIGDEQLDGHGQVEKDPDTREPIGYLKEDSFLDWTEYRVGYDLEFARGHRIELRATDFRRDQRVVAPLQFGFQSPEERYRIEQDGLYGELRWSAAVGARWRLSAGWSREDETNTVSGQSLPPYLPVLEESVEGWGAFHQASVALGSGVTFTFGSRYDDFELFGSEWSPRASLLWKPIDAVSLRASTGYGFCPPRPVFNEICCGQTPERNTDLRPERSRGYALLLTWQPSPAWKVDGYLHRTAFDDYLIKMTAGSVDLRQKIIQGNVPEATVEGADLRLRWRGAHGFGAAASYSWTEARNDGESVTLHPHVWDPVDIAWPVTLPLDELPYHASRKGQAALSYTSDGGAVSITAKGLYTGAMLIQQYDDVPYSAFPPTLPPGGLREDYRETPDFWVVHLTGSVRLRKHAELLLGVDNVLDYVQTDLDDFSTDYNWGPIRGRFYYASLAYRY